MSWNETLITIVGNVVTDVVHKHTADGTSFVNFRVGSTARRYDRNTGQYENGEKLYLPVTCWRRLADGVAASLSKGDPVIVQGKMRTRGYETDGQRRTVVEVEAVAVGPDLNWCQAVPERNPSNPEIVAPRVEAEAIPF